MKNILKNIDIVKKHNLSRYKVRNIRAKNFHILVNNYLSSKKGTYIEFKNNYIFLTKLSINFWNVALENLKARSRFEYFTDLTEKLDYKIFTPGEWNEISMYFASMGYFKLGYIFRENSYKSLEYYQRIFPFSIFYKKLYINSLLERGEIEKAIYYNNKYKNKNTINYDLFLKSLFDEDNRDKKVDLKYYELIKDKNIAVIGPAKNVDNNGREINSYDMVVRLNLLGFEQDKLLKEKEGERTDIIYYNNETFNKYLDEAYKENILKEIKYIVYKNNNKLIQENQRIRKQYTTDTLAFNGSFNLIQSIILDLITFKPKSIKIFGVNFYTSLQYSRNYIKNEFDLNAFYLGQIPGHDIYTQYLVTKMLCDNFNITGDNTFMYLVNAGIHKYIEIMEQTYPVFLYTKSQ